MKLEYSAAVGRPPSFRYEAPAMTAARLPETEIPAELDADGAPQWEHNRDTLTAALFDVNEVRLDGMEQMPAATDGSPLLVALGGGRWAPSPTAQVVRLREYQDPTLDYDLHSLMRWQGDYFCVWVEEIDGARTLGIRSLQGEHPPQ